MAGEKERPGDTQSLVPRKKIRGMRKQRHGLYCDPNKIAVDGRSFFARLRKKIKGHFLECFEGEPSAIVQTLADGVAANLIIAKSFQAAFLRGNKLPPSILRDYTGLWNSISRDLATLSQMAKESGNGDKTPSLQEHLEALKSGKLLPVEPAPVDPKEQPSRAGGRPGEAKPEAGGGSCLF